MTINTASGAKLYIGSSDIVDVPEEYDDTEKAALILAFEADSYIEVGEVEDLGEFGDQSEAVKFTSLSDARTRSLKGPRDAGDMAVVAGDDPNDDGQTAMEAAEGQPFDYNFKVVLNDAQSLTGTDSVHYFHGKVMGKRRNVGQANNVVRRTFTIGINSKIVMQNPT